MPPPVWFRVLGLMSSLASFLWDITNYHVLSVGVDSDWKSQIRLLPYYSVHFVFRTFCMAAFFIYWRVSLLCITGLTTLY